MKIIKSKRKGNTNFLEIEIPCEILEKEFDTAFRKLVKKVNAPGFRKGKIPRHIFEKNYGKSHIIQDGISSAMNTCYLKAIQELNLQVVDYPQNINTEEYKENEPVRFTCDVTVKPEIKLGKYKGLKLSKQKADTIDDKVEAQLQQLREQMAHYETVERPVQKDDIVRINIKSSSDNTPIDAWSRDNMAIKVGIGHFGDEFDSEITGMNPNDEKSISLTYDDTFSQKEVAGKTVDMTFQLQEVREKQLPALNDEFASKVSEYQTINELKEKINVQLTEQSDKEIKEKLQSDLMELIAEKTKVDLPEIMVTNEMQYDLQYYEDQLKKSGGSLDQYLEMTQKTRTEFEDEIKEGCHKRVLAELILEAVADTEGISVTDDDLKAEVKRLVPSLKTEEEVNEHLQKVNVQGFRSMLQKQKTMDFLIDHAKITEG